MTRGHSEYNDAILAGIALFSNNSYDRVPVKDILQATGLNRYSVYSAFGGKKEFFVACIESYCTTAIANLSELVHNTLYSPSEAARKNLYAAAEEFWRSNAGCLICERLGDIRKHFPDLEQYCVEFFEVKHALLCTLFNKAEKNDALPKHMDPATAAKAFLIFKFGLSNEVKRKNSLEDVKSVIDSFVYLLIAEHNGAAGIVDATESPYQREAR